jgi:hypothetical protein
MGTYFELHLETTAFYSICLYMSIGVNKDEVQQDLSCNMGHHFHFITCTISDSVFNILLISSMAVSFAMRFQIRHVY